jgi:hypothetical protein
MDWGILAAGAASLSHYFAGPFGFLRLVSLSLRLV